MLHVDGAITIEDLDSSNGTKLRGRRAAAPPPAGARRQRARARSASLILIIQARFAPTATNRIATHDYFVARIEEECARASRSDVQFAVIGIGMSTGAPEGAVIEALISTLRQSDVLAKVDEHAYELLLLDTSPAQANHVAQRLVASLRLVGSASSVVAHFPTDGRDAYTLITRIAGDGDVIDHHDLVIVEPSMRDLYALARRIAASDLPVLILGETGVGKEEMSRSVHEYSPRAEKPFVAINCAALNDNLLESELFGHERGAFTGAHVDKTGLHWKRRPADRSSSTRSARCRSRPRRSFCASSRTVRCGASVP